MNKKFLSKFIIASVMVGGVNFSPAIVNFDTKNLQIISVARAEIKTYTGIGKGFFNMKPIAAVVELAKNHARMEAIEAAREKAGVYIKSQTKVLNSTITSDSIYSMMNDIVEVVDVKFKNLPIEADDDIATKYEATAIVKIDTNSISKYLMQDPKLRSILENANKDLKKSIAASSREFENFSNNAKKIAQETDGNKKIEKYINKINDDMKANQKTSESNKFLYEKDFEKAVNACADALKLKTYEGNSSGDYLLSDFQSIDDAKEKAKEQAIRQATEIIVDFIKQSGNIKKVTDPLEVYIKSYENNSSIENFTIDESKIKIIDIKYDCSIFELQEGVIDIKYNVYVDAKIDENEILKWQKNILKQISNK